jgi:DNA-binding NarL/FixJ family response regulator
MALSSDGGDSSVMLQADVPVKVFLVDDSDPIRERVAAMLASDATEILGHARTPEQAIERIVALRPDVVVLDIQLDGGTGLQVLRAVRRTAPDVAFIVFSNHAGPAYRKCYLGEGAVSFLDKSVEFDQLPQAVAVAPGMARTESRYHQANNP